MSIYAIGDIQGCFEPLQRLLFEIRFNPNEDQLWLAGDLVNRGPQSLEVLRWARNLGDRAVTVLGNHDLHLLARYYGQARSNRKDTLDEILSAPDCDELMHWLRHRSLFHYDSALNWCMSHAGLPPIWSEIQAKALAMEVEAQLQGPKCREFLQQMYGNQPDVWCDNLVGIDRYRVVVNYLTRMRFLDQDCHMDLKHKEEPGTQPEGFWPWFELARSQVLNSRVVFGHWAALLGKTDTPDVYAIDTGCVWGNQLTAMRLEDQACFSVDASPTNL